MVSWYDVMDPAACVGGPVHPGTVIVLVLFCALMIWFSIKCWIAE